VRGALDALSSAMAQEEAPAHVEAKLLDAFRQRQARRRRLRWVWVGVGGVAVAAAGLIVALLPLWREIEKLPLPNTVDIAVNKPVPVRPTPVAPREAWPPAQKRVAQAPRKVTPVRRAVRRPEVASDFFPLRPGPVVDAGEFASLVRVSLPRSEMRRFGLFPGFDAMESVQADVVIGQDGMARAVRFVSVGRR
jgi:hypothetical protein